MEINNLQALNNRTITGVRVVNVEDVLNENNVRAFNNALSRNEVDIAVLQNFLNNSLNLNIVTIREVLSNNNVAIGEVVTIDILSGGDVVIYVQQKPRIPPRDTRGAGCNGPGSSIVYPNE